MKRVWSLAVLMAAVLLATSMMFSVAAGPPDEEQVPVKEERGKPLRPGKSLWVFVFPAGKDEHPGKAKSQPTVSHCPEGSNSTTVPKFAGAKLDGMTFVRKSNGKPSNISESAWEGAVQASFGAWDNVTPADYFTVVAGTGDWVGPKEDGTNIIGWAFIVPKTVLAAAWVVVDDATGRVTEADVFFNNKQPYGVFTSCNAQDRYEVGNVGTHEVGHVVALDHLNVTIYPTMYPSASKGEVRKRSLTAGDGAGFEAALAP